MNKIAAICIVIFVLTTCAWAEVHLPDPHNHGSDIHAQPWDTEEVTNVVIMQIEALPLEDSELGDVVVNESQTMRAFLLSAEGPPEWQCEYVYFQDLQTDQTFVILGIPVPWRPFSDLAWVKDQYLVFDRWSQPHFGWHYVVDTKTKKIVLARPVNAAE
ncbi:hypothetical protein MASR1M90_16150 [Desulfovibrionales bacterium]